MTDDARQESQSYSGQISGLRWEAERCPDTSGADKLRATALGGGGGFVSALLFGLPPQMRLLAAAGGALLGHLASSYHLNLDWDPDSLFGGEASPTRDSDDPDVRPL